MKAASAVKEILIGTHNRHKAEEISQVLAGLGISIKTLNDFPKIDVIEETGETLLENSILKAKTYGEKSGLLTLADDTGLEVDALNGEPGVRSARYAGESCSYGDNNRKLIENLRGVPEEKRTAAFKCVIALFDPGSNELKTVEGVLPGRIISSVQGANGFGYDPVFYVPALNKTLAELSLEEKNKISHRGQAVSKMRKVLEEKCRGS